MNRTLQLLGLLLIGLLSFQAEPVRASQSNCGYLGGCYICFHDDGCYTWVCGSYGAGANCN